MCRTSLACCASACTLRNVVTLYSDSGIRRSASSWTNGPQRRRQANSRSKRARIEPAAERHELVFRAAAHQRRHDFQNPRAGHREPPPCTRRPGRSSARQVLRSATASPPMLKK